MGIVKRQFDECLTMINYEFWSKDNDNSGYDDGNYNNTDNDRQIHLKPHNAININLSIYLNVYTFGPLLTFNRKIVSLLIFA